MTEFCCFLLKSVAIRKKRTMPTVRANLCLSDMKLAHNVLFFQLCAVVFHANFESWLDLWEWTNLGRNRDTSTTGIIQLVTPGHWITKDGMKVRANRRRRIMAYTPYLIPWRWVALCALPKANSYSVCNLPVFPTVEVEAPCPTYIQRFCLLKIFLLANVLFPTTLRSTKRW